MTADMNDLVRNHGVTNKKIWEPLFNQLVQVRWQNEKQRVNVEQVKNWFNSNPKGKEVQELERAWEPEIMEIIKNTSKTIGEKNAAKAVASPAGAGRTGTSRAFVTPERRDMVAAAAAAGAEYDEEEDEQGNHSTLSGQKRKGLSGASSKQDELANEEDHDEEQNEPAASSSSSSSAAAAAAPSPGKAATSPTMKNEPTSPNQTEATPPSKKQRQSSSTNSPSSPGASAAAAASSSSTFPPGGANAAGARMSKIDIDTEAIERDIHGIEAQITTHSNAVRALTVKKQLKMQALEYARACKRALSKAEDMD